MTLLGVLYDSAPVLGAQIPAFLNKFLVTLATPEPARNRIIVRKKPMDSREAENSRT